MDSADRSTPVSLSSPRCSLPPFWHACEVAASLGGKVDGAGGLGGWRMYRPAGQSARAHRGTWQGAAALVPRLYATPPSRLHAVSETAERGHSVRKPRCVLSSLYRAR